MATLLHRWKLDENTGTSVNDTVGSQHATITESGGYPIWRPGIAGDGGSCLEFDDGDTTHGVVTGTTTDSCDNVCADYLTYGPPVSVTCWIKPHSLLSRMLIGYMLTDLERTLSTTLYIGTDNKPRFGMGGVTGTTTIRGAAAAASAISANNVYFLAGTWDCLGGAKLMSIYVNGALAGTATHSAALAVIPRLGYNVRIGGANELWRSSLSSNFPATSTLSNGRFNGLIDDCRIYCGTLTDSEIGGIYQTGPPNAIMFSCNT